MSEQPPRDYFVAEDRIVGDEVIYATQEERIAGSYECWQFYARAAADKPESISLARAAQWALDYLEAARRNERWVKAGGKPARPTQLSLGL